MKKRIIAGILRLILALTSITGCSGSGNLNTSSGGQARADAGVAADYPEKNTTIILPYGTGSSQEALLRMACKYVEKNYNFKKSFVISNQEGGSGEIGLTAAFNVSHDGYTLAMFHSPHIALKLVRGNSCKFSYEDFMLVTNFITDPCSWLVNNENARRYPDPGALIKAAKAAPGTVFVVCGGVDTSEGCLIKQIQRATGAEFKIVPIDNDAEFVSMLRGSRVDALVTQVDGVIAPIEEGVSIPLCVGTSERIEILAGVPTLKELGYDIESYSMRSLAVLKGTPDDIYELLCKAFDEAMHSEEVTKRTEELGVTIDYKTPEEVYAMWGEIDKANRKEWEVNPWN